MSTASKNPGGATAQPMKDRLTQLQRELARMRRGTQVSNVLTFVVGVLVLAALAGYFAYGYVVIKKELTDPEKLVGYAEQELKPRLREGRETLEKQIVKMSPEWAERLSQQALDNVPTARQRLEKYSMEQYDSSVKRVTVVTDEQFRKYLKENRPMLEKRFKELADTPELSEAQLTELEQSLAASLETDMKGTAKEVLDTLIAGNAKLKLLKANQKLTLEQQNERLVLTLFRALQQKVDPGYTERPIPGKETTGKLPKPERPSSPPGAGKTKAAPPVKTSPKDAGKGKATAPKASTEESAKKDSKEK
jgi:hypothetical protein